MLGKSKNNKNNNTADLIKNLILDEHKDNSTI